MNPRAVAELYQQVKSIEHTHTLVGTMRVPWLIDAVLSMRFETPLPNWLQGVYFVDEQVESVEGLDDPRVDGGKHLFLGPGAEAACVRFFRERPNRPLPAVQIAVSPWLRQKLDALDAGRQQDLRDQVARVKALDTEERAAEALRRIECHPMKSALQATSKTNRFRASSSFGS